MEPPPQPNPTAAVRIISRTPPTSSSPTPSAPASWRRRRRLRRERGERPPRRPDASSGASATSGRKNIPASTRTFSKILSDLQRSKISMKDWSLSDVTIGLYLIYLSQASTKNADAFKGVQISSSKMVQELIYHLELGRGCYKGNATGLARYSMLRNRNAVKFVKDSSILRPGYYEPNW